MEFEISRFCKALIGVTKYLVKKGKDASKPENHIQTAYVTAAVKNNTVGHSKETKLEKGEYVYFCPLNPTPQYSLIVE